MLLIVLAWFVTLTTSKLISLIPCDNRHYVEGKSRYIWMSNGEGHCKLVDLQAPVQANILKFKNGTANQYWLYTRRNQHEHQLLIHGDANSISASNYLGTSPIKIIVHGWLNNGKSDMNSLIKSAFLAVHDSNVIVVDWGSLAHSFYSTAIGGVPSVGQYLGEFLVWLIDTAGGDWHSMHLVGFSLGAHIVGVAGHTTHRWPGRVTGLDPAGPLWGSNPNALNSTAGIYVEAIHTDGGVLGSMKPIADADFYPNGGNNFQPGCWLNVCSHGRAVHLFAATVHFNHLEGKHCSDIAEAKVSKCTGTTLHMGNGLIYKYGVGIYGLITKNLWPY